MKMLSSCRKARKETIGVHEEFFPYHTKPLDSKHRISLGGRLMKVIGKRMRVEAYQIFVGRNGDILLRPTVSVPSNEAWIYRNPEIIGKIRKGLKEAGEGKIKHADDLESFLNTL